MNSDAKNIYKCPSCLDDLSLKVIEQKGVDVITGSFHCTNGHSYTIEKGIPDFTWPKELASVDQETKKTYEKLAKEYDKFASIPFLTFKEDEEKVRHDMIDRLNISSDSVVLEVGGGDGRGAEHIAKRLGRNGKLYLQELSPSFMGKAIERLAPFSDKIEISFFDVTGKQVFPVSSNMIDNKSYKFDLSNIPQGVFLVKCILGTNAVVARRLVISR